MGSHDNVKACIGTGEEDGELSVGVGQLVTYKALNILNSNVQVAYSIDYILLNILVKRSY